MKSAPSPVIPTLRVAVLAGWTSTVTLSPTAEMSPLTVTSVIRLPLTSDWLDSGIGPLSVTR